MTQLIQPMTTENTTAIDTCVALAAEQVPNKPQSLASLWSAKLKALAQPGNLHFTVLTVIAFAKEYCKASGTVCV